MEKFNILKNDDPLDIQIIADTVKPAQTLVYKVKGDSYELLTSSKKTFDGNIAYNAFHEIIFEKITDKIGSLKDWKLRIVTFVNSLPASVKNKADFEEYVLDGNVNMKYTLKEKTNIQEYGVLKETDFVLNKFNEGIIIKDIEMS
ncbi:hypothetical protein [Chryseobacterium viscerum]|uniref:Uncharacterized protein n=1 Tax=Chryseobacterium viscerum TaxID=1037377 RepID=A0A316WQT0_9FLAO|nr:hypothetical protein [Chryseobacterium viscerum]PWN61568.1 hypothetical protein C1634_009790 [Chryseobacterium viscerum]